MTKPYTATDLSNLFDEDLIWRRKELSDLKSAIRNADIASRTALLKALVTMAYAHWEGYVKSSAMRYFTHLTLKQRAFSDFSRQFYANSFLARLDALSQTRIGMRGKSELISEIIDGLGKRFSYINPGFIDTKSNLNSDVIADICLICGVDGTHFESKKVFIDKIMLKRRNAIAHGQQELIDETEIDDFVSETLALMDHFRTLLENCVYQKTYLAA